MKWPICLVARMKAWLFQSLKGWNIFCKNSAYCQLTFWAFFIISWSVQMLVRIRVYLRKATVVMYLSLLFKEWFWSKAFDLLVLLVQGQLSGMRFYRDLITVVLIILKIINFPAISIRKLKIKNFMIWSLVWLLFRYWALSFRWINLTQILLFLHCECLSIILGFFYRNTVRWFLL